jgi:hypothetical protein
MNAVLMNAKKYKKVDALAAEGKYAEISLEFGLSIAIGAMVRQTGLKPFKTNPRVHVDKIVTEKYNFDGEEITLQFIESENAVVIMHGQGLFSSCVTHQYQIGLMVRELFN